MRTEYNNTKILIRFREPMEEVIIEGVSFVLTEDDYLKVVTINNKKYLYNRMYVLGIEQLDEEDKMNIKNGAIAELAKRELQRRKINKAIEKLNGNELNQLEIFLLNEVKPNV